MNITILISIIIVLLLVSIKLIKKNELFSPYAQILIPKIYLSDTAHDNRKSCDVARFDVSGVYNRTMLDTFNPCHPYSYWEPLTNMPYIGNKESIKMGFNL